MSSGDRVEDHSQVAERPPLPVEGADVRGMRVLGVGAAGITSINDRVKALMYPWRSRDTV